MLVLYITEFVLTYTFIGIAYAGFCESVVDYRYIGFICYHIKHSGYSGSLYDYVKMWAVCLTLWPICVILDLIFSGLLYILWLAFKP